MEATYEDRLDIRNVETVALPKIFVLLPFVLLLLFVFAMLWVVIAVRDNSIQYVKDSSTQSHRQELSLSLSDPEMAIYPQTDLSPVFTPEVLRWAPQIKNWANEYKLPQNLIAIVMQIESCGNPNVRSNAGAIGLFQVMPYHFAKAEDPFEVQVNASRGLIYLAEALDLGDGRIDFALAGYNGGHSQISKPPHTWPDETVRYVQWGSGIWEDIMKDGIRSHTLDTWLAAGGSYLCERAQDI